MKIYAIITAILVASATYGQTNRFTTQDFLDPTVIAPGATFDMSTNTSVLLPDLTVLGGVGLKNSTRTNFFLIRSLSDFPVPTNGIITLLDDSIYELNGVVDVDTNRLVFGSHTWLKGQAQALDEIVYHGTGWLLTADNDNVGLSDFTALCTNASFGNFEYTGTNISIMHIANIRVRDSINVLTISNFTLVNLDHMIVDTYSSTNYGIQFGGPNDSLLNVNDLILVNGASNSTAIDLRNSVWLNPTFDECFIDVPPGGIGFLAQTNSANVATNGLGALRSTIFRNRDGTGTNLVGITLQDSRWELSDNPGVTESTAISSMYITNQVNVAIDTVNVPKKVIGGQQWVLGSSAGFLFNTNGTLTYNKVIDKTVLVTMFISLEPVAGNRNLSAFVSLNGSVIALSEMAEDNLGSGTPATLGAVVTVPVTFGDNLGVFVENRSNAGNIVVNSVKFAISE